MTAPLAVEEKSTLVMIYTPQALVRGTLMTRESVRVSILLRTDGAPRFFHLYNAQMIFFGGGQVRSTNHPEIYVPIATVIAFHIVPPAQDPLDYEEGEKNRAEETISAGVGTFIFKGNIRFSAQSGLASSLEMTHSWMSMYEVEVSNPSLPQMPTIHVPMLLVDPRQVTFSL